jgi:hypothetical protein
MAVALTPSTISWQRSTSGMVSRSATVADARLTVSAFAIAGR